jgi:two-component system response regulator MprA
MRILVVDDERAVRESLRRALELEGYEVELAADGQAAIDRLETEAEPELDALLLDVLMPGLDGLDVCRRLRRSGSRSAPRVCRSRGRRRSSRTGPPSSAPTSGAGGS